MTTTTLPRLALAAVCTLLTAISVFAQTSELNGTWTLNPGKSDFGKDRPPKSATVTVTIREPRLQMAVASVTFDDKVQNYTLELTTDGRPVLNKGNNQSSDSAHWEGPTLVVEHNEPQYTLTRRIDVSKDGKTATSKDVFKAANGQEVVVIEVFDRQAQRPDELTK